jgi:glycosyltransferase involved in cell wall biosynthesis
MTSLSVVIPVYRAEHTLRELHRRLTAVLEKLCNRHEILLVEDCGGDRSWEVIEELARQDPRVKGIQLSRNFGQHAATICGITQAEGDYIVTMDDDLEHEPEAIGRLLAKAQEGYALVYGVFGTRSHSPWRNFTSALARRLFRLAVPGMYYETSFRMIARSIAQGLREFDTAFPFIDGYLFWLTSNYATVEVAHGARTHGTSNYNFGKLLGVAVNVLISFSSLPLRLASWVGIGASLLGLLWLGVILLSKVFGGITVSGYASVMAGILLFGGVQLLVLGIFGEYLNRINFRTLKRPLFLVGKTTGPPPLSPP